jgi:hypothetical protein
MNKTEAIGNLVVIISMFCFLGNVWDWINGLQYPYWAKGIFGLVSFGLWYCGMAYLYFAEKAMRNKKNKS